LARLSTAHWSRKHDSLSAEQATNNRDKLNRSAAPASHGSGRGPDNGRESVRGRARVEEPPAEHWPRLQTQVGQRESLACAGGRPARAGGRHAPATIRSGRDQKEEFACFVRQQQVGGSDNREQY